MVLTIKELLACCVLHMFWIFPIKRGKVLFKSFEGKYINDNPDAVYNALIDKGYDGKICWVAKKQNEFHDIKTINPRGLREIFELATSNCWVDNVRKPLWVRKRKGQIYIQLWHGDIPLKKIEKDAEDKLSLHYIEAAKNDSKMIDLIVSGSAYGTRIYKNSFWYNGRVLECGVPRSCVFFKGDYSKIIHRVKRYYNINEISRVILYAPTFRNEETLNTYNIDYRRIIDFCQDRTGENWTILMRMHPNVSMYKKHCSDVLDATRYYEVNELVIASDIIITDYSSLMFDGMLAGKKVILFVSDCEKYKEERGLYFSLDELPFPKVYSVCEIEKAFNYVYSTEYDRQVSAFEEELGIVKNPNSSFDVAEYIVEQMGM